MASTCPTILRCTLPALLAVLTPVARADPVIENRTLRLAYDVEQATFSLTDKASGLTFIDNATLFEAGGRTTVATVEHPHWGAGRQLRITWPSGSVSRLSLYDKLPFLAVQTDLHNPGPTDQHRNQVNALEMDAAGPVPVEKMHAFGTFGLTDLTASSPPGSYGHLALVDPASRAGCVVGFLSADRGSGVLFFEQRHDHARITARIDHGHLLIKPGRSAPLETLLVGYFPDARLGLEAYADALAVRYQVKLPPQPTVYCTWYHARASNAEKIIRQADFAARHLKPFGFQVIQIDDGWQDGLSKNGPRKIFIRHRPDGPYPQGMKAVAQAIRRRGLTPGLWFMPFAGTYNDPFFADKQEQFARLDGQPFDTHWGGTCFDLTHPAAQQHVRRRTATICRDWGFGYIKIDGMWTAMACPHVYVNAAYKDDHLGRVRLHDPSMTHIQAFRKGVEIVRQAAGPDTFILGCNLAQNMRTLIPSIGCVDAMRVGPDNGPSWSGMLRSAFSGANLYFLHRRTWYNDPDPLYVRPALPLNIARCFASFNAVTGQLHASSFQFADLPADRLDLLKRCMPSHTRKPRPVDLFDRRIPRLWLVTDDRRDPPFYILGLFNWDDKQPADITESFDRIGLPHADRYVGFDYWADRFVELAGPTLRQSLPPASCRVLALRPASDRPLLVSTSRHITQSLIDVIEEKWNAATRTLHGRSRLVAADPCQFRIARPATGSWRIRAAACSADAPNPQPTITLHAAEKAGWRLTLTPGHTGIVSWSIQFE